MGNLYWDSNASDNLATPSKRDQYYANPSDVRSNVGYRDAQTNQINVGTMPVNPDVNITLGVGQSYNIPIGWHSGNTRIATLGLREETLGTATAKDIAKNMVAWVNGIRVVGQLDISKNSMTANATEDDIINSRTAWVNGVLITGRIPVIMREDELLPAGSSYVIPYGLHGGQAVISAMSLRDQTIGTAKEEDILRGKVAWANGVMLIGSMETFEERIGNATATAGDIRKSKSAYTPYGLTFGAMDEYLSMPLKEISAGSSFRIPIGYTDGTWVVQAASLASQTAGTATPNDIRKGETAWANGIMITGTMIQTIAPNTNATATKEDIREGETAWVNGEKVTGVCKYDTVNFIARVINDTTPEENITILLPEHNWSMVRYVQVIVRDISNGKPVSMYTSENYVCGDAMSYYDQDPSTGERKGLILRCWSILGDPKITFKIQPGFPDWYYDITVIGYTMLKHEE